jgi:hypothetical protein
MTSVLLENEEAFADENGGASAVDAVLALMRADQPVDYDPDELLPVQLAAMSERLASQRAAVGLLDRRADHAGIAEIGRLDDAVPLLFSHASYKSYPESLVTEGRWAGLLRWLDNLATEDLAAVDVADVSDLDDFLDRLWSSGHPVLTTSGTSGKCSLLPQSTLDIDRNDANGVMTYGWSHGLSATEKRPGFFMAKRGGPYGGNVMHQAVARTFVDPDACHFLYEERERVTDTNRAGRLAKRVADRTATPSEIAEAKMLAAEAARRTAERLEAVLDALLEHSGEPVMVWGTVFPNWQLVDTASRRGARFEGHPRTAVHIGGGTKSNALPPDFAGELERFYAPGVVKPGAYGQSEVVALAPQCSADRYHFAASTLVILLDESGRTAVPRNGGRVEGLFGVYDIAQHGRWGGLLTSDWLTVHFDRCPCGMQSPSVVEVSRLDGRGDDKVSCAGRAEMYVRGA